MDSILNALDGESGSMAAVLEEGDVVEKILGNEFVGHHQFSIANYNGPKQTVISGAKDVLEKACAKLEEQGLKVRTIPVSCAFHSPMLKRAKDYFLEKLNSFEFKAPKYDVYSNLTSQRYPVDPKQYRSYLADQIISPVRFNEQIRRMYDDGARVFIEAGPGSVLSGLIADILQGKDHTTISCYKSGESGLRRFMVALAELATLGVPVDTEIFYVDRDARQIELDHTKHKIVDNSRLWYINGYTAWPVHGEPPKGNLKNLKNPLGSGNVATNSDKDQTVSQYLAGMREVVAAQRDVMLRFLGKSGEYYDMPKNYSNKKGTHLVEESKEVTAAVAHENLLDLLLSIVSEKTGYPIEMLDLDLNIEADLGIDSIKRIEVFSHFFEVIGKKLENEEDVRRLIEELSTKKTFRMIGEWLNKEQHSAMSVENQGKDKKGDESFPQEHAKKNGVKPMLDSEMLSTYLRHAISSLTGYAKEDISVETNLETDLGIDVIKRFDAIKQLHEQFQIFQEEREQIVDMLQRLAVKRTIKEIVDLILDYTKAEEDKRFLFKYENDDEKEIQRYLLGMRMEDAEIASEKSLANMRFVITVDQHGVASALVSQLESQGAHCIIYKKDHNLDQLSDVDGIIHLAGLNTSDYGMNVNDFFPLLQKLLLTGTSRVYAVTGFGGVFDKHSFDDYGTAYLGISGLLKTVKGEFPEISARIIDIDPKDDVEVHAANILTELKVESSVVEVGYIGYKRYVREYMEVNLKAEKKEPLNSTVIVF